MSKLRFLVDACVDVRVAQWLRDSGYAAQHLREIGMQRLPNGEIFVKAIDEQRVVLTHDVDFGEIAASSRGRQPSVIVFRLHDPRATNVIRRLDTVLAESADDLSDGVIVIVEESRYRVRHLPIGKTGN